MNLLHGVNACATALGTLSRIRRRCTTGMIENIWDGLLLGALYLACGRNLAAPLIAHATSDTIDFILIYLGKYPGMR